MSLFRFREQDGQPATPTHRTRVRRTIAVIVAWLLVGLGIATCTGKMMSGFYVETYENVVLSPDGTLEAGVEVVDQGALGGSRHLVCRSIDGESRAILINANWSAEILPSWSGNDRLVVSLVQSGSMGAFAGRDLRQDDTFSVAERVVRVQFPKDRPTRR